MAVRRIVVEIETTDNDLELSEYIEAIEDACHEVERRPMIAGETKIRVGELLNG